jgi:uncharacterized protein (TIGR03067 family)
VAAEQHGGAVDDLKGSRLVVTGDEFMMTAPRGEQRWLFRRGETRGTLRLRLKDEPRGLDLVEKARTLRAIFLIEGDQLTLCVGDPDVGGWPRTFATNNEDRRLLLVLQREGKVVPR